MSKIPDKFNNFSIYGLNTPSYDQLLSAYISNGNNKSSLKKYFNLNFEDLDIKTLLEKEN